MNDGGHAWELAHLAVRALVDSGSLTERLRNAWAYHLMVLMPQHELPWPDIADRFRDIADYFPRDPNTGMLIFEGLSEDDQRERAKEIVDLYDGICRRYLVADLL